ncbi:MAG: 2-succinyl-5-enolpyruvyl-6-hydroxy-3-cyclohexene-1-carboxylic-acid synthase, partial [Planctomycetota bacterium]
MRRGWNHFFVAPGSRCTPLTLAIARQPDAIVTQHFDERGLAFATLGYARASRRPGIFVCTSGTAVANAFPAVIEASMESIPMLLLTADRPPELLGTGSNQTINQEQIFGNYPVYFGNVFPPEELGICDQKLANTLSRQFLDPGFKVADQGPVHFNLMFREPFTTTDENGSDSDRPETQTSQPAKDVERDEDQVSSKTFVDRQRSLSDTDGRCHFPIQIMGNTLMVAGTCDSCEANEVLRLSQQTNCPLLSDITSGLRTGSLEIPDEVTLPRPDNIVHFGDRVVSKSYLRWTKKFVDAGTRFFRFTASGITFNPNKIEQTQLRFDLRDLDSKLSITSPTSAFQKSWRQAISRRDQILALHFDSENQNFSEPAIAHAISRHCPPDTGLFIGNSMPIRDLDWYGNGFADVARQIVANRGASGIDGLIATAAGYALGLAQTTTVVVGDLSTLHDLNSFALVAQSRWPMIVIVVNNGGGHIFDMLPIHASQH